MLKSERLVLRDFGSHDGAAMLAVESDQETVRYQSFEPRTAGDCDTYIARDLRGRGDDRTCFDLAVTLAENGRFVGRVGLDIKLPEASLGELWFILDRSLWGQGLMPEAVRLLVTFGFQEKGLHRVFLECDPRNRGAIRLAEKLGFVREGQLRAHAFIKGESCDSLFFGVLATEW